MAIGAVNAYAGTKPTANIVMSPGHLLHKWKREIEKFSPLSRVEIVHSLEELIALKQVITTPLRQKHLWIIVSKEVAKFQYFERPSAVWSRVSFQSKQGRYVCPECGKPLYYYEYEGKGKDRHKTLRFFGRDGFTHKTDRPNNQTCTNMVYHQNTKTGELTQRVCGAPLWTPAVRPLGGHQMGYKNDWIKVPGCGSWIQARHIDALTDSYMAISRPKKKETEFLAGLLQAKETLEEEGRIVTSMPRRYSLAKYVKRMFSGKIDFLITDEIHCYNGDSEQGRAFGQIASAAKKVIGLTGTLINGYASGIFSLLFRSIPHQMKAEGFKWGSSGAFVKEYGVIQQEETLRVNDEGRMARVGSLREKELPGISPLVFTKFLLEYSVFLGLDDIMEGMPGYTEIPVGVAMDSRVDLSYKFIEKELTELIRKPEGHKILGQFYSTLSTYPDQPNNRLPLMDPDTGEEMVSIPNIDDYDNNKENTLIDLIKPKLEEGKKVLIYTYWTKLTSTQKRLKERLAKEGFKAAILDSGNGVKTEDREAWINDQVENKGIDVLICNPMLVETGLDLLAFRTIVFYQTPDNSFTMRQASRRSWRLSQEEDVEVYFLYYQGTVQERSIGYMANKVSASKMLEGKFNEDGLQALAVSENMLAAIASSVANGLESTLNTELFQKVSVKSVRERIKKNAEQELLPICCLPIEPLETKKRKMSLEKLQSVEEEVWDKAMIA